MSRNKKVIAEQDKEQTKLICPICGIEILEKTPYIVKEGCTCSWECFLIRDKENREKKILKQNKTNL